jgi:DNA-binding NarL/FixJ family response regulator
MALVGTGGHHAAMSLDPTATRPTPTLIRVVVVDDHPAMRAGIGAVLDAAPDLQFVGEASDTNELWPVLTRTDPDVVLVDFHLPGEDGLLLCHRIKRAARAPRVVVYSAYADESLVAPAMLAQADALIAKHASSAVLCEALRDVVHEPRSTPELAPELRERLVALLEPDEVALAGLLLLRTPTDELVRTTGCSREELSERVETLLRRISSAHGLPV